MGTLGARASGQTDDAWAFICDQLEVDAGPACALAQELLAPLDGGEPGRGYAALPQAFFDAVGAAVRRSTAPHPARVLDLLLVELVRQFDGRFARADLPEALLPYYAENIDRILERAMQPVGWARSAGEDVFLKDLGILRMTLIPCASHLVFRNSGVPRSLVLRQRPPVAVRALRFFLLRCGGFAPFIENHVHPAMLGHFSPAGRQRCYELVAELLRRWPENRGLMGLSWYYDPVVARISPRLAYLREVPENAGALFLPAGTGADVVGGATSTSATRRRLYEAGQYRPTRHLMAWSRRDLLSYCGA
jgi:hypothetical protein